MKTIREGEKIVEMYLEMCVRTHYGIVSIRRSECNTVGNRPTNNNWQSIILDVNKVHGFAYIILNS